MSEHEFGFAPLDKVDMDCRVANEGLLPDSNIRFREIGIELRRKEKSLTIILVMLYPKDDANIKGVFLMPSFMGNHALPHDKHIRITNYWMREANEAGIVDNKATEASRRVKSIRAPIEMVTARGYTFAAVYCCDIDPDFDDGFNKGVHALFPDCRCDPEHPNRWGTIAAWAWGLSRCVDCIEQD